MTEITGSRRRLWVDLFRSPWPVDARSHSLWSALRVDTLWVGATKVLSGVVFVGINLWAASHLDPAAFGVFALSTTSLLLIDNIVGSAVDMAVLRLADAGRVADRRQLDPAERAGLILKLLFGVAMVGGGVVLGEGLGRLVSARSGASPIIGLVAAAGVGLLLLRSGLVYFQSRFRFDRYGMTDLSHTFLRLAFVTSIFLSGAASPAMLLMAYALAPLVVLVVLIVVADPRTWEGHWCDFGRIRGLWKIAKVGIVTFGLGTLVARLDIFLLEIIRGPYEVGILGLALTIAAVPEMIGAYLAPVFTPRIMAACREGQFGALYARVQVVLIAASAMASVAVLALTRPLASLLVPAEFAAATGVFGVLVPAGLAGLITFPVTFHFLMFFKPRIFVLMDLVSLPILVVAYVYAGRAYGALGVAWVSTVSRLAKAAIAQVAAARLASRPEYLREFAERLSENTPVATRALARAW